RRGSGRRPDDADARPGDVAGGAPRAPDVARRRGGRAHAHPHAHDPLTPRPTPPIRLVGPEHRSRVLEPYESVGDASSGAWRGRRRPAGGGPGLPIAISPPGTSSSSPDRVRRTRPDASVRTISPRTSV